MHFNGLKLSSALKKFSITSQFLGSKVQNSIIFKKIRVLRVFFFCIEVQVISNASN